jgi:digeranylgeranylglycerophospholipid reductase
MRPSYDAIVVGAGPAGSVAARRLAERGFRVLLIEKRQEIGVPVRCAEAVGADSTRPYIEIDDRWVKARVSTYSIQSASGACVKIPPTEPTLVVDRKVFDWELARLASQAGAEVRTRTEATGLLIEQESVVGIRVNSLGRSSEVQARLVIAADGIESQVARWAGLKTTPPMADYYVGFQYLLGNLRGRFDPTNCEYHLDQQAFPGGYGWVFPKGDDTANVGLVIAANRAGDVSAQRLLDRFVERKYPEAHILGAVAGGVSATGALKKMVTSGLVAVGDAAHQADPLTAGGINLGMIGADLASQVAADALARGDVSARVLSEYETRWQNRFGAQHRALYRIRKLLTQMEEKQLAHLINVASGLPLQTMGLRELIFTLFKTEPRLLAEVGTLVTTGLILK